MVRWWVGVISPFQPNNITTFEKLIAPDPAIEYHIIHSRSRVTNVHVMVVGVTDYFNIPYKSFIFDIWLFFFLNKCYSM